MDTGGNDLSALEQPQWKSDRVEVECPSCGDIFEVSYRYANEIRRRELRVTCQPCRIPLVIVVTEATLNWWRERFSDMEILEIAEGMWGHVEPSEDAFINTNLRSILSGAAEQQVTFPDH